MDGDPRLRRWKNNPQAYVPPIVRVDSKDSNTESVTTIERKNGVPEWGEVLNSVLSHPQDGRVWIVVGESGLGKTALLENWAVASIEGGLTAFLVTLQGRISPSAELTSLMHRHGDIPWWPSRKRDLRKVEDLISRGRFLLLLDGLSEDPTQEQTLQFVRMMAQHNIVVMSSQFEPNLTDIDMRSISLGLFGTQQLHRILPSELVEPALHMTHLKKIISLPESALLLKRYVMKQKTLHGIAK